ncbi:MAG: efflux RND transporter periplasmic adaptor subunit [Gammaproteobacteria bacterium]|nr:efflux RND transporter periplasmic adaptor subunit [Gammaproteobacteria bacterium]
MKNNGFIIKLFVIATLMHLPNCIFAMGAGKAAISIHQISPQNVSVSFEYVGEIQASKEVQVRARITGIIEKRLFTEGQQVKQGDLLFQLDDKFYQAQLLQAKAALAVAKATRVSAVAQYNKAKRDYARISPLSTKDLVSKSNLDNAKSAIDIAQASIEQADASIQQAQAAIKTQQINLDYTQVTAPINGLISRVEKDEGSLVEVGSNSLLATITQIHPAYVNFYISESEQSQRNEEILSKELILPEQGYTVKLITSNGKLLQQAGEINFKDYKVNTETGSFLVRASIENSEDRLFPGQFVRVHLEGAYRPDVYVLPQKAVMDSPKGKFVYVVQKNDKGEELAIQTSIKVGEWVDKSEHFSQAWIIKSGLKSGDKVVIDGMARIFYSGMPVTIEADEAKKTDK